MKKESTLNKNRDKFAAISGEESSRMYGGISYPGYSKDKDDFAIGTRDMVKKGKNKHEEYKHSKSGKKIKHKKKKKHYSSSSGSEGNILLWDYC